MLKIDEDALRAKVIETWEKTPPPIDEGEDAMAQFMLMQRAAKLNAELTVFSINELKRCEADDDPMQAILNLGAIIANVVFPVCKQIAATEEAEKLTGMDGPHSAIHLFIESISTVMHAHYHEADSDNSDGLTKKVAQFELPLKEVGDA